jgi:hypothetical protein
MHGVMGEFVRKPTLSKRSKQSFEIEDQDWAHCGAGLEDTRCPQVTQHDLAGGENPVAESCFPIGSIAGSAEATKFFFDLGHDGFDSIRE